MVVSKIITEGVRILGYIGRGLAYQDKIILKAYGRGRYGQNWNPHAVKGIRHGLAGGQVAGGLYVGLTGQNTNVNIGDPLTDDQEDGKVLQSSRAKAGRAYKARRRCPTGFAPRKYKRANFSSYR